MPHTDDHLKFVNHELRNALAPLVNYIQLLKMQGADPVTISKMESQVMRLRIIMDQLLQTKP
jgi:light-regulated signal transduction histidine kinase (bacteriophytochrome)